jgi:hypothetical protein
MEELKRKYTELRELKDMFDDIVYNLVDIKQELENVCGSIEEIDYHENTVDVKMYEPSGCGCCVDESYYYTFDVEDLFDVDNYKKKLEQRIKDKEDDKLRRDKEEKDRIQKEKEEMERKEYIRLQEKYGNETITN